MYSFPNLDQNVEFHGEVLYLEGPVNKPSCSSWAITGLLLVGSLCSQL